MASRSDQVQRFLDLCGYPDAPSPGRSGGEVLLFDGIPVEFIGRGEMLELRASLSPLPADPEERFELLGRLLALALPRAAREDCVLSLDRDPEALFLWTGFAPPASDGEFLRKVEGFLGSVEWWNRRIAPEPPEAALRGPSPFAAPGLIRP